MELRIRDLREDRDLKQKQVADYLLCDQSLYSKYERGERPLPLDYADKLADFYGVSVDYLLGRTNVEKPYPKKQENPLLTEGISLFLGKVYMTQGKMSAKIGNFTLYNGQVFWYHRQAAIFTKNIYRSLL